MQDVQDMLTQIDTLVATVKENAAKCDSSKAAARRARVALNDLKKICTPLRSKIQEVVKNKLS